jgi:hypothetical protein
MAKRVSTLALIQITVEMRCGTYGPECTMGQILEQAAREGRGAAVAVMQGKGRVIGDPVVRTVTTVEDPSHD